MWLGGSRKKMAFQKKAEAREQGLRALFQTLFVEPLWIQQESDFVKKMSKFFLTRRSVN